VTSVQHLDGPIPEVDEIETEEVARIGASPWGRPHVSIWLIGVFALCFVYFFPSPVGPNEAAHLDLTRAIVDHGSFTIDAYHANTEDVALYHGHYYVNKAPGQSLLGVPIYFAFKAMFHPVLAPPPPMCCLSPTTFSYTPRVSARLSFRRCYC